MIQATWVPALSSTVDDFREVSPTPSQSRELVPVPNGAQASFDSRLDQTLARNAAARRSHGSSGTDQWWSNGQKGVSSPNEFVSTLNALYADPEEAEVALYAAQANRMQAQSEHEAWMRREYERKLAEEKAAGEATERHRQEEKRLAGMEQALRAVSDLDAAERRWAKDGEEYRSKAALGRSGTTGQVQQYTPPTGGYGGENISEDLPPENEGDDDFEPDDFDPDDEPTHIADARYARAERARQAATGPYGPKPFEAIEDDDGNFQVKPMMREWTLEDLALCNKLERERRERVAARKAQMARSTENTDRVRELFSRKQVVPPVNVQVDNEPPRKKTIGQWIAERFGAGGTSKGPRWT